MAVPSSMPCRSPFFLPTAMPTIPAGTPTAAARTIPGSFPPRRRIRLSAAPVFSSSSTNASRNSMVSSPFVLQDLLEVLDHPCEDAAGQRRPQAHQPGECRRMALAPRFIVGSRLEDLFRASTDARDLLAEHAAWVGAVEIQGTGGRRNGRAERPHDEIR